MKEIPKYGSSEDIEEVSLKTLGTMKNAVIEKINIEDKTNPLNLKKYVIIECNYNQKLNLMANKKDYVSLGLGLNFSKKINSTIENDALGIHMNCGCSRNGDCCNNSFEEKCYKCGFEIEKGTETVVDGLFYHKRCAPSKL